MDYARVYGEFIADRLLRQAELVVYETHHILPRCLGGVDESGNLVRLELGEHLFAHILLAKIHGGPCAIALILMIDHTKYNGRKSRSRYRATRLVAAEHKRKLALQQWSSPEGRAKMELFNADPAVRTKRSVDAKARWNTPDSELRKAASSPEACAAKSAAAIKRVAADRDAGIVRRPAQGLKHSEEFKLRQRLRMRDPACNPRMKAKQDAQ